MKFFFLFIVLLVVVRAEEDLWCVLANTGCCCAPNGKFCEIDESKDTVGVAEISLKLAAWTGEILVHNQADTNTQRRFNLTPMRNHGIAGLGRLQYALMDNVDPLGIRTVNFFYVTYGPRDICTYAKNHLPDGPSIKSPNK